MAPVGVGPSLSVDGQKEGNRREKREPPALDPEDGKADRQSGQHDRDPHEKATHPTATLRSASARVKRHSWIRVNEYGSPPDTSPQRRPRLLGNGVEIPPRVSHSFLSGV